MKFQQFRNHLRWEALLLAVLLAVFSVSVSVLMGSGFAPYRLSFVALVVALLGIPGMGFRWWQWRTACRTFRAMSSFGTIGFDEISARLSGPKAFGQEVLGSQPYLHLHVVREQIGDSLAESEREVLLAIEEISTLSLHAKENQEHIGRSIQSGRALTENRFALIERSVLDHRKMVRKGNRRDFSNVYRRGTNEDEASNRVFPLRQCFIAGATCAPGPPLS
jgi:hypothetical protein